MPRHMMLAYVLCACSEAVVSDQVALELAGSAERRVSLRDLRIEPAENVHSARMDARGRMLIERVDRKQGLKITAPGLCPVRVAPGPQAAAIALRPVLELGGDRVGIGYGTRFSVQVQHNCLEQDRGQVAWRQLEGPALAELQLSDAGFQLSARSASFVEAHPEPAPAGIVPISPRTQARVLLEASWRGQGASSATRTLTITAAARSTGLSSMAVSQPLVLAGDGWRVKTRPAAGHASLQAFDGLTFFTPDAPGSWTLSQHEQTTLKLQALTHDATPYDCGRAECHAALSEHAASSPMSHALERPLSAQTNAAAVSCMIDCHVLGERGLSDGGFQALSARLGFTWTEHTRWEDLPQTLRRLGGVRCTACHGPGAIPPPEQRDAILHSDVCASCHDAPPRYVHVSQWRSGRMASSDRDPATRQAPCARCHTTAGFLAHAGVRKLSEQAEPAGIACAACHAPHSAERGPRLIRNVEGLADVGAELFPEPSTLLCRACHASPRSKSELAAAPSVSLARRSNEPSGAHASAPGQDSAAQGAAAAGGAHASVSEQDSALPAAAAGGAHVSVSEQDSVGPAAAPGGTLWTAEIAVPASQGPSWERVSSRSVHAQVPRGCIGCHGGAALPSGSLDHSFRADERVCASCHADDVLRAGRAAAEELRARALALSRALDSHCSSVQAPSPHAQLEPISCSSKPLERARYEVGVVLDDAAAVFHNPDLSRALLTDAAQRLSDHDAL